MMARHYVRDRKGRFAKTGSVTVYHYTTPRKAKKIVAQQHFKTHSGIRAPGNQKNQVYVTRRRSNFYRHEFKALGRESAVVSFKVPSHAVTRDKNDVFFLPYVAATGSKYKPANAYKVDKSHLNGVKISLAGTPVKKRRKGKR